jgi:RNA polymerase sigma-70 factor (ECF subfamily)
MSDQPVLQTELTRSTDRQIIAALRAGDETAFAALIDHYHAAMIRLAQQYVQDPRVAEEVAQETWLEVLQGIGRFEARSSLKTWIFRILTNIAKTRGIRERRSVPFSAIWGAQEQSGEPALAPHRLGTTGHWVSLPDDWAELLEDRFVALETRAFLLNAIDGLPPGQRIVISLRDVEGWSSEEVCKVLGLSDTNQRVLLHRARSNVRAALEQYLRPCEQAAEA